MFALRCRHYSCGACWSRHIAHTLELNQASIPCIYCSPANLVNAVSGVRGRCREFVETDFIVQLCGTEVAMEHLQRRMR